MVTVKKTQLVDSDAFTDAKHTATGVKLLNMCSESKSITVSVRINFKTHLSNVHKLPLRLPELSIHDELCECVCKLDDGEEDGVYSKRKFRILFPL